MDTNKDGLVSREEFEKAASGNNTTFDRLNASAEFDRFDVDHDGFLSLAELELRSELRTFDEIRSQKKDCCSVFKLWALEVYKKLPTLYTIANVYLVLSIVLEAFGLGVQPGSPTCV